MTLFDNVPEVSPEQEDLQMIKKIAKRKDKTVKTIEEIEYNGKILLRVPKSLHKQLVAKAKAEGVSLNQLILYRLAQ